MKILKTSREVFSWALYDWANSTYSTTVIAGFFPIFFQQYWSQGSDPVLTTARLGTMISFAGILVAIISPFLGALSDLRRQKKLFTFLFMMMGALSSAGLAFVGPGQWLWAAGLYALGTTGFNASCTFYDSLLPGISNNETADYASSLGYSLGYLGGGVLFALNVLMYLKPQLFGLSDPITAVRISFVLVALWWVGFSIPLFKNVREPAADQTVQKQNPFRQLALTAKELIQEKNTLIFLVAFWLYIDGVYTVMNMAVDFGISLGFPASTLISALLLVQFVGFPFALLFSKIADHSGSKVPIQICLLFYAITLIGATRMTQAWHFYVLATMIGMAQGGVQALSRSMFSKMTPVEKSGEYFGFFNLIGKFASVLGPLLLGWGTYLFHDHRKGLLMILILFAAGSLLLRKVQEPASAN